MSVLMSCAPHCSKEFPVRKITLLCSLVVSGVTLRGEGMDKTILSFKNQVQGEC